MNSISYLYDRPQVYTAVYLRRTAVKRTVYTLARGSARTESRVRHKFCYGKTPLSEPRLPTGSDLRFMAINIVQINKLDQHQNVVFLAIQRALPPPDSRFTYLRMAAIACLRLSRGPPCFTKQSPNQFVAGRAFSRVHPAPISHYDVVTLITQKCYFLVRACRIFFDLSLHWLLSLPRILGQIDQSSIIGSIVYENTTSNFRVFPSPLCSWRKSSRLNV